MKRLVLILILSIAPLAIAMPASAQWTGDPFEHACQEGVTNDASVCGTDGTDPISGNDGIILRVVRMLGWVVGFVSVLMIMIAAIKYITANGDPASIKSARDTIIYALIGVAVFSISQVIVRFLVGVL